MTELVLSRYGPITARQSILIYSIQQLNPMAAIYGNFPIQQIANWRVWVPYLVICFFMYKLQCYSYVRYVCQLIVAEYSTGEAHFYMKINVWKMFLCIIFLTNFVSNRFRDRPIGQRIILKYVYSYYSHNNLMLKITDLVL